MTFLASHKKMKALMTNYYFEAKTTQEKPIAWVTSGAPVEFLYAPRSPGRWLVRSVP